MGTTDADDGYRLDEIDRRIIYELMVDARNTSAPMIADDVNVSAATVRNRLARLEDLGIVRGYRTVVDFERADGSLTTLFQCNVPVDERDVHARTARSIPGVINVRTLMTGKRNLHVLAVGADTSALVRVGHALTTLGIEIVDEDLVHGEFDAPYDPYGPDEADPTPSPTDVISLTGDASVVECTVRADAPVAGQTLAEASSAGIFSSSVLVIAIERDGAVLTPHGETTIREDDVVTLLSRSGLEEEDLAGFLGDVSPTPLVRDGELGTSE